MWQYYTEAIKGVFRRNQNQSGSIRNNNEASGRFRKHQTRQGYHSRLGGQALQGEQTRQGDQAGQGDQPWLWGQALQKEQAEQGYQAEQGHPPWLGLPVGAGPSRENRLGRESRLRRETSLWWVGRLCMESWLGITYSKRFIYYFNPTSPPPLSTFLMLTDPSRCFLGLLNNPDHVCLFFINLFLLKSATISAVQCSLELGRLGERCKIFQSWQLHYTDLHGLPCLHCFCSFYVPCFKTVNPSCLFLLRVLATSPGASLLYNNNTDRTVD